MLPRLSFSLIAAAATASAALAQSADEATAETPEQVQARPIVVELFTSQGCMNCPRANAHLRELSQRDGLLALSLSVDYWDYRGWMDTYAQPAFADRQRDYVSVLDNRRIYTPQMVIDGAHNASGTHPEDIDEALSARLAAMPSGPDIALEQAEDALRIQIAEAELSGAPADIWLFGYAPGTSVVDVQAGANRGRELEHFNVVLEMTHLGEWSGEAVIFEHPATDERAYAVLVQSFAEHGVIAAASIDNTAAHLAP